MICIVPIIVAILVAISRVTDYWHNIDDILTGMVLGCGFAWVIFYIHVRSSLRHFYIHVDANSSEVSLLDDLESGRAGMSATSPHMSSKTFGKEEKNDH